MSNHTPGPWKQFGQSQDRYLAVIDSIPDRKDRVVANCICHVALTNKDAKANAQLIAAAPELLEALDSLVSACDLPGDHCEVEQALPRAIAAIKKAKGES
jgi:hypothetical protein